MKTLNLQARVKQIYLQVKKDDFAAGPAAVPECLVNCQKALRNLRQTYEQMYGLRNRVGRMPPRPNTARARAGAYLVGIVQRMLFWYTPQIVEFQNAIAAVAENACLNLERQLEALCQLAEQTREIQLEVRAAGGRPGGQGEFAAAPEGRLRSYALDTFEFELRNHPRIRDSRLRELDLLHRMILTANPPAGAPWLDLGCCAGDWCRMAAQAGEEIIGVEANLKAAEYCRDAGISICAEDYLRHLEKLPDRRFAVITALHLLERYPFDYVFALTGQAARVLRPGGLFLLKSYDPSNLLNGGQRFWNDTGNQRFVPQPVAESMLQFFGFEIIVARPLDAGEAEDRLPWEELELVKKLNDYFHRPGSYALIGRRTAARPA